MIAILSLIVVLNLSLLITRVGSEALVMTGVSRQIARFQARSAFSGVGFTTKVSEQLVNNPMRRSVIMWLMLLGNVGFVTVLSSLVLSFTGKEAFTHWWHWALFFGGITGFWILASSKAVERVMSRAIRRGLRRWTALDRADYAHLLHLSEDYIVVSLRVDTQLWMKDRTLAELHLEQKGMLPLGVEHADGTYHGLPDEQTRLESGQSLVVYGPVDAINALKADVEEAEKTSPPGGDDPSRTEPEGSPGVHPPNSR